MQDLLLAQKRHRPAYCFQHLDPRTTIPPRRLPGEPCRRQRHACSPTRCRSAF